MSKASVYFISKVSNGFLFIGPRPQAQSLKEWTNQLQEYKINHVVSLIEEAEVTRHGLQNEGDELNSLGIGFTRFSVDDFQTPNAATLPSLINDLSARLSNGEHLFLHCAGGVGRAGTITSCLMVKHGMTPNDAMELVSQQRGEKSPETDEQANFVRAFQP